MKVSDDMYEEQTIVKQDGSTVTIKVLKTEFSMNWKSFLEESELIKYNSLSEAKKIQIAVSSDPFKALKLEIEKYHDKEEL